MSNNVKIDDIKETKVLSSSSSSSSSSSLSSTDSKEVKIPNVISYKNTVIQFPDGTKKEFSRGTSVAEVMKSLPGKEKLDAPIVCAYANNLAVSLNSKIGHTQMKIGPVLLDSDDGMRTYRKSLVFMLSLILQKIEPKACLVVRGALGSSAYYCELTNTKLKDFAAVLKQMDEALAAIVKKNLPIKEHVCSFEDALKYIEAVNLPFLAKLLNGLNPTTVRFVECDGYMDIRRRPLIASTGMLTAWEIKPWTVAQHSQGFLVRFPLEKPFTKVSMLKQMDITMFDSVYSEHDRVSKILNNYYVGQLNEVVENLKSQKDFISLSEALSNQKISDIAQKIAQKKTVRLVTIAGPSSSGKTTFAKKLMLQLRSYGLPCSMISVDDYYKKRADCPKDSDGAYNFDCLEALRCDVLNDQLTRLFKGENVETPIFNFKTGMPEEKGRMRQLADNGILIMEGIFGLNPKLTSSIPIEKKFRIFIAPLSQLNLDEHSYISNPQVRLLRLIVRDNQHRGWNATQSLQRWPSVRRAERSEILQYFGEADAVMNSSVDYELNVMKVFALPLLHGVKASDPVYNKARELINFLNAFYPIPHHNVPRDSLLREFIGDSFFEY
eukprot:TRINITY_DN3280_c0_g2_i2.p1 TRINITY_DN3280_c0_g2~~TRINITY_DN3280_c0_g2_i2.p1  ORF type:complete len:620 (-),score=172.06 TRINITY_DN3280_c0_g2_i2:73-1896(-)